MTPEQAADLAARSLAVLNGLIVPARHLGYDPAADRERVASDLDLFTQAWDWHSEASPLSAFAAQAAEAGLRRTAALYGVTP